MIYLENAQPRITEAIENAEKKKEIQEVKFIYNELNHCSSFNSVFEYLLKENVNFGIRHDEYRFVLLIFPKKSTIKIA